MKIIRDFEILYPFDDNIKLVECDIRYIIISILIL